MSGLEVPKVPKKSTKIQQEVDWFDYQWCWQKDIDWLFWNSLNDLNGCFWNYRSRKIKRPGWRWSPWKLAMVNTSSYDVDKMNSYKPATLRMTRPTERHRLTSVCEYSLEMLFVLTPPHPLPLALPSKQLHEAIFCWLVKGPKCCNCIAVFLRVKVTHFFKFKFSNMLRTAVFFWTWGLCFVRRGDEESVHVQSCSQLRCFDFCVCVLAPCSPFLHTSSTTEALSVSILVACRACSPWSLRGARTP